MVTRKCLLSNQLFGLIKIVFVHSVLSFSVFSGAALIDVPNHFSRNIKPWIIVGWVQQTCSCTIVKQSWKGKYSGKTENLKNYFQVRKFFSSLNFTPTIPCVVVYSVASFPCLTVCIDFWCKLWLSILLNFSIVRTLCFSIDSCPISHRLLQVACWFLPQLQSSRKCPYAGGESGSFLFMITVGTQCNNFANQFSCWCPQEQRG